MIISSARSSAAEIFGRKFSSPMISTNLATIAVKILASGPTPEARANAMDSGSAIIATIMPAVQLTL